MRTLLVYCSGSGNTKALADEIVKRIPGIDMIHVKNFNVDLLAEYDGLIVGSYTIGNGALPKPMEKFYQILDKEEFSHMTTAVFGTGETGYHYYCQAVNDFRDLLYAKSNLAVTLKVEQVFQDRDILRIEQFCKAYLKRILK